MKKVLLAFAALLTSGAALAEGYFGIAGGRTQQKVDCSGTTNCDITDTGRKLYGGYKLSPFVAVELSYTDFGEINAVFGNVSASYTAGSLSIGSAAFLPLTAKLMGVARVGISSSKAEVTQWVGLSNVSNSETHTHPYVGLGLGFALTPTWSLNTSFDYARIKYNDASADSTLLAIGLSQTF
jgi:OOP family OmpA-OmpF porin